MAAHPLWLYSRQVLSFRWPGRAASLAYAPTPGTGSRDLNLALTDMRRHGRDHVVLFGLGSGALARGLASSLPHGARLTVCDVTPGRVQALLDTESACLAWVEPGSRHQLAADSSPWALLMLMAAFGPSPQCSLALLNPELDRPDKALHATLLKRWTDMAWAPPPAPPSAPVAGPARPRISAAAILRPDEPGLDGFFAQFPSWLCELAVVWDGPDASPQDLSAQAAPAHGLAPNVPLRQTVRPLDNDFAAQRNAMLGLCTGDWVFYLDGDERLVPEHWEVLRGLAGGAESGEVVGYHLPRLAFYPDMDHCMAGLGLWPDLQLRLFRRAPGLRFQGAAHERLEGLAGPTAALCALPILHYSHVRKDGGQWKRKLELYDRALGASGLTVEHRRNVDYPHLETAFFETHMAAFEPGAALLVD